MGMFTLSQANKKVLLSRLRSLAWRAGMMLGAILVETATDAIGMFDLPPSVVVVLGLMLGEVSKYFRVNVPEMRAEKARQDVTPPPQE